MAIFKFRTQFLSLCNAQTCIILKLDERALGLSEYKMEATCAVATMHTVSFQTVDSV